MRDFLQTPEFRSGHLLAAIYPHLCRIDYDCNNYRMRFGATESSHETPVSCAANPPAGFFATFGPIVVSATDQLLSFYGKIESEGGCPQCGWSLL
jgi:hypothetical protein